MSMDSGETSIDVGKQANSIMNEVVATADWEVSSIVNRYKGKGASLERGNYRGYKQLEHALKEIERIV